jgi:hypothetical protein
MLKSNASLSSACRAFNAMIPLYAPDATVDIEHSFHRIQQSSNRSSRTLANDASLTDRGILPTDMYG